MKKILAIVLAMLMCFAVVACTKTEEPATEPVTEATEAPAANPENPDVNVDAVEGISEDAVLKVAADGEPDSIFPAYQQNKTDNRVNSSMFNYLVEWDDVNKVS